MPGCFLLSLCIFNTGLKSKSLISYTSFPVNRDVLRKTSVNYVGFYTPASDFEISLINKRADALLYHFCVLFLHRTIQIIQRNCAQIVPKICQKYRKISKHIERGKARKSMFQQGKSFIFCAFALNVAAYTR